MLPSPVAIQAILQDAVEHALPPRAAAPRGRQCRPAPGAGASAWPAQAAAAAAAAARRPPPPAPPTRPAAVVKRKFDAPAAEPRPVAIIKMVGNRGHSATAAPPAPSPSVSRAPAAVSLPVPAPCLSDAMQVVVGPAFGSATLPGPRDATDQNPAPVRRKLDRSRLGL